MSEDIRSDLAALAMRLERARSDANAAYLNSASAVRRLRPLVSGDVTGGNFIMIPISTELALWIDEISRTCPSAPGSS